MTDKLKVILAGKEYVATAPLTLGQLQDLRIAVVLPPAGDAQEEAKRDLKRSIDIICGALAAENPEFTPDKMLLMRITPKELNLAVSHILTASGLVTVEKADGEPAGEAKAAAE